jgi:hypothetical protein
MWNKTRKTSNAQHPMGGHAAKLSMFGVLNFDNSIPPRATSVCSRCFNRYIETMKRLGRISVCLAVGLALNAGLRAASPSSPNNPSPENPYATVAVRNIFGLNPPALPPDPSLDAEKNLPKITPTGIMSVFGYTQVLFKVAAAAGAVAKAGQPAKEEFYILSQGQRQDDIEVIKIDEKNSLVTFDNHGTTQELPLASTSSSGTAAASPSPITGNPGMVPRPTGGGGNNGGNNGGFNGFGAGPGGNNGGMPNSNPGSNSGGPNGPNAANGGMSFGGNTQGHIYQPEPSTMTAEEEAILTAAQHRKAIDDGDPIAPLYPTTPIDKEAGITPTTGGGNPPTNP